MKRSLREAAKDSLAKRAGRTTAARREVMAGIRTFLSPTGEERPIAEHPNFAALSARWELPSAITVDRAREDERFNAQAEAFFNTALGVPFQEPPPTFESMGFAVRTVEQRQTGYRRVAGRRHEVRGMDGSVEAVCYENTHNVPIFATTLRAEVEVDRFLWNNSGSYRQTLERASQVGARMSFQNKVWIVTEVERRQDHRGLVLALTADAVISIEPEARHVPADYSLLPTTPGRIVHYGIGFTNRDDVRVHEVVPHQEYVVRHPGLIHVDDSLEFLNRRYDITRVEMVQRNHSRIYTALASPE